MAINWFDVTDYGAVGNGSTDDTSAIQDAIDAAGAIEGSVVFYPAGRTYRTTSTLTAAYNDHTWLMYGATILADFDGVAVRFGAFDASHENCSVYGGNIVRTDSQVTRDWSAGNIGWQWLNISRFYHVDYYIRGFHTGQQLLGAGQALGAVTFDTGADTVLRNSHGLVNGNPVVFWTTGTLPTGIVANALYYVVSATTDSFQVSVTAGGSPIDLSGSPSGTHTVGDAFTFGVQYGHLVPRHIISNKFGIHCTCRNGGWCNENAFFGAGRVGNISDDDSQSGAFMISLERGELTPNVLNNNKFYGLSLENAKTINKPKAINCNAMLTLFDFLRFEGFDDEFIETDVADFVHGGNSFRGGCGLTTPGECLTNPTQGAYLFLGSNASVYGGASPDEGAMVVRDMNSANNYSFRVQDTMGNDWFKINGVGLTQVGMGAALGAKLAVINNVTSQRGIALKQPADATVPAIEVQNASGDPVFLLRKSQGGGATESDVAVYVGDLGTNLIDAAGSTLAVRGPVGALGAVSTRIGKNAMPGVLVIGNDDDVVADFPKPLVLIKAGANPSSGVFENVDVITVLADGPWDNDPDLVMPTRTFFTNGSRTSDPAQFKYLEATSTGEIGFFGVEPVVRPTVSGSDGSNAALASLLTALVDLGLITYSP